MNLENVLLWIIGGGMVALIGLLLNTKNEQDKKIGRVYERLDEVKDSQDETFTRKDMCQMIHDRITTDLTEIKVDIKTLLLNGIQYQGRADIQGSKGDKGD